MGLLRTKSLLLGQQALAGSEGGKSIDTTSLGGAVTELQADRG